MGAFILTHDYLQSILDYDPATGAFTWKVSPAQRIPAGSTAGSVRPNGYIEISIKRRLYKAQRLAWFYVHGVWPNGLVDHKDHNTQNNSIANLRVADTNQSAQNRRVTRSSKTGFKGVFRHKNRFQASIGHNGRYIYLGLFKTAEEARDAYLAAAERLHGEFACR